MAEPLASVADLETRLGEEVGSIEGADLARANNALTDASVLVRSEGLPTWDEATVPEVVSLIVVRVALRQYRNPDGFKSEAMGSGAYTYAYADDESSAYLTETELRIVQDAAADAGDTGAGFVGSIATPSAYVPLDENGEPYDPIMYGWVVS